MQNRYGLQRSVKKGTSAPVLNMPRRDPKDPDETYTYAVEVSPLVPPETYVRLIAKLQWGRDGGSHEALFDVGKGRRFQVSASNIQLALMYVDDGTRDLPEEISIAATASWGGQNRATDRLTLSETQTIAAGASYAYLAPPFALDYSLCSSLAAGPFTNVVGALPLLTEVGLALLPTETAPRRLLAGQNKVSLTNNSLAQQTVTCVWTIGLLRAKDMSTTLEQGHRYRAAIVVNGFAGNFAGEGNVKDAFEDSGFTDVHVYRNHPAGWTQPLNKQFYVEGTWARPTVTTEKVSDKATFYGIEDVTPKAAPPAPPSPPNPVEPPKNKIPVPPSVGGNPGSHAWARQVLLKVWTPQNANGVPLSMPALQMVQATGLMEGGYGYAKTPPQWYGSNNWAASQVPAKDGVCPVGTFPTGDTNPDAGGKYVACILTFPTPEAGAINLLKLMTKTPEERAALASGSIDKVCRAMYKAGFYVTSLARKDGESNQSLEDRRVKHRAEWLEGGIRVMAKALGEPVEATRDGYLPDEEVSTGKVIIAGASMLIGTLSLRALNNRRNR